MPPDFRFLDMSPPLEVIVATQIDPASSSHRRRRLGRARATQTRRHPGRARADLQRLAPIWLDAWPIAQGSSVTREAIENWRITPVARPLKDDMVGDIASALWVLMGAIGAVLLVACANIANLMLVRADARRPELASAPRSAPCLRALARELLVESLVIGAVGGRSAWCSPTAGSSCSCVGPTNLPRLEEIAVYARPSSRSRWPFRWYRRSPSARSRHSSTPWKADMSAFGGVARGSSVSRERSATRSALVVVQVALALVLVVSAVLMIRTFQALRDVNPGFVGSGFDPNRSHAGAEQSIRATRSVIRADAARDPRRDRGAAGRRCRGLHERAADGRAAVRHRAPVPSKGDRDPRRTPPPRKNKFVSPGYLETMGTRIIAGRDITWADIEAAAASPSISEEFARELGARPADALGNAFEPPSNSDEWREIVGVVQSVKETRCTRRRRASCTGRRSWRTLRKPGVRVADQCVRRPQRPHGHREAHNEIREAVWSVNRDVPIALGANDAGPLRAGRSHERRSRS